MLKSLTIKNFTVFSGPKLSFSPGINVFVGENGMGKSHLLKLGYVAASISHGIREGEYVTKQKRQTKIAEKLNNVFRPEYLGRLARRKSGRNRCEVDAGFFSPGCDFGFSFASNSREEVSLTPGYLGSATKGLDSPSVFFPTKEVISMFPGFASIYRDKHIEIDETYYDLCLALERPLNKGPRFEEVKQFLEPLEAILGGKVRNEGGRFKLAIPGQGNMEIPLVAEGHRKLATIAYLLANGSILKNGIVFWDEPETNLNPVLMDKLVATLVLLAEMRIQIFLATHSLYFLKELDQQLRSSEKKIATRWFSLFRKNKSVEPDVHISSGKTLEEIEPILSLDAEIRQSERFFEMAGEEIA